MECRCPEHEHRVVCMILGYDGKEFVQLIRATEKSHRRIIFHLVPVTASGLAEPLSGTAQPMQLSRTRTQKQRLKYSISESMNALFTRNHNKTLFFFNNPNTPHIRHINKRRRSKQMFMCCYGTSSTIQEGNISESKMF